MEMNALRGPLRPLDPIAAILADPSPAVLAIVAGVEGPSYRPVGATMALWPNGRRVGALSSGCIEADLARHALAALDCGQPRALRYGRGSPFADLALPCGGGLDILLVPAPDRDALSRLSEGRAARCPVTLEIACDTGALKLLDEGETGRFGETLRIRFEPDRRFFVFGAGPEATTFTAIAEAAGFPCPLLSPDAEARTAAIAHGALARALDLPHYPDDLKADAWTGIVLFFHDHDWEPPILARALATPAFYVGAQGSLQAAAVRRDALQAEGLGADTLSRLRGPMGLIPSARDPATLAVSVLAEALADARAKAG